MEPILVDPLLTISGSNNWVEGIICLMKRYEKRTPWSRRESNTSDGLRYAHRGIDVSAGMVPGYLWKTSSETVGSQSEQQVLRWFEFHSTIITPCCPVQVRTILASCASAYDRISDGTAIASTGVVRSRSDIMRSWRYLINPCHCGYRPKPLNKI